MNNIFDSVSPFYWPESLEQYRIPDELMARAYEQTPATHLAAIKTALALHFFNCQGQNDRQESGQILSPQAGFIKKYHSRPALWTALIFATPCGAAQTAAAAALPILAGVNNIAAFFLHNPKNSELAALELCGIEDIFYFDEISVFQTLNEINNISWKTGVCFSIGEMLAHVSELCGQRGGLYLSSPASFTGAALPQANKHLDIITFCLGHEPLSIMPEYWLDAIYTGCQNTEQSLQARMVLDEGCEGFWSFPGLIPDLFQINLMGLSFWQGKEQF